MSFDPEQPWRMIRWGCGWILVFILTCIVGFIMLAFTLGIIEGLSSLPDDELRYPSDCGMGQDYYDTQIEVICDIGGKDYDLTQCWELQTESLSDAWCNLKKVIKSS